jgi:hypothetical protein
VAWAPIRDWQDGQIVVADVDGDGSADVVGRSGATGAIGTTGLSSTTTGGNPIDVARWTGNSISFENWLPSWDLFSPSATIVTGDFNGDHRQDLAARDLRTSMGTKGWQVALSSGTQFATATWGGNWDPTVTWKDIRAGDFDGDSRADIAGRNSATGEWQVSLSSGTGLVTRTDRINNVEVVRPWGIWSPAIAWKDALVGDFDGDGRADLVGRDPTTSELSVARSTGTAFASRTWGNAGNRIGVQALDLNRDGRTDLIGRQSPNGNWEVSLAGTGPTTGLGQFLDQPWGTYYAPFTATWQQNSVTDFDAPWRATLQAFNQVRNTVKTELYPGLMKGAKATLETKEGNDWDQAAAMMSLIGSSGVPNRFVKGRIQVDKDVVNRWVGATGPYAGFNVLAVGGLHATKQPDGTNPISSVIFDHTWVQVTLPGPDRLDWFSFDPSWKFHDFQPAFRISKGTSTSMSTPSSPRLGGNSPLNTTKRRWQAISMIPCQAMLSPTYPIGDPSWHSTSTDCLLSNSTPSFLVPWMPPMSPPLTSSSIASGSPSRP